MPIPNDQYSGHVAHPRYGRRPNITGLNPDPLAEDVHLHWNASTLAEIAKRFEQLTGKRWPGRRDPPDGKLGGRIPNTAIVADLARQSRATVQVTHYFDIDRVCRDCDRPFIFFAAEQKHWYEQLGFGLESDCLRCVPCRKREQGLARCRQRYEELFHVARKSDEECLEMAECGLALMEAGVFGAKLVQRIRTLLNKARKTSEPQLKARAAALDSRVARAEDSQSNP